MRASPAAAWLGMPADNAGRLKVEPDLTAPGRPEIFVIGDTATIDAWHGKPVPGIAPAAWVSAEINFASNAVARRTFPCNMPGSFTSMKTMS